MSEALPETDKMVSKKEVLKIVWASLNKIPEDDVCDECEWVCQMINNDVEKL